MTPYKEHVKKVAKRTLPTSVLQRLSRYRSKHSAWQADIDKAWNFKREFFWDAFKALDFNDIDGDYVEFGSHGGITFRLAFDQIHRRKITRHLWAFDSFRGLPEASSPLDDHAHWKQGAMATGVEDFHRVCESHGIARDSYTVVEGFYEQTLTQMPDDAAPTNIALAYIDCDMFSSTKAVLEFLAPRLKHGMILAFDDYFCWSAKQISGERKAFLEVLSGNQEWNLERYRDYGWGGTSFVVERADLVKRDV